MAHSLLVSIYHMLRDKRPYADLGPDHFDTLDTARLDRHHVKRLNAPGFGVTLTPLPPACWPEAGGRGFSRDTLR